MDYAVILICAAIFVVAATAFGTWGGVEAAFFWAVAGGAWWELRRSRMRGGL